MSGIVMFARREQHSDRRRGTTETRHFSCFLRPSKKYHQEAMATAKRRCPVRGVWRRRAEIGFAGLLVLLFAGPAYATIFVFLDDPFDDRQAILSVRGDPRIASYTREVEALRERLLKWKERDFHAIFGEPVKPPRPETHAMLCTEPRGIGLSGIRYMDEKKNKDHVDAYTVPGCGRIDVYFQIDGVTPAHAHFYLTPDGDFPKLDRQEALEQRLDWERPRFQNLVKFVNHRWREVVVWEVDEPRQRAQFQDVESGDFILKAHAMMVWGASHGYRLRNTAAGSGGLPHWAWYDGERMVAEALCEFTNRRSDWIPSRFVFYRENGTPAREYRGRWNCSCSAWWRREDGEVVRSESGPVQFGVWRPTSWSWRTPAPGRFRVEEDTNGDGVPDALAEPAGDFADAVRQPLPVEKSWAIHPKLIPDEGRVPEQEARALPIRKIPE
ncbi:MAG: hypothetical protein HY719_04505 [Planctomycetes bacterium]|nr:hypothetical protein [Planctomycetota bacterium]